MYIQKEISSYKFKMGLWLFIMSPENNGENVIKIISRKKLKTHTLPVWALGSDQKNETTNGRDKIRSADITIFVNVVTPLSIKF